MNKEPLVLSFDNRTIRHLGISLYSTLPPVIAELIANSYDANASKVNIFINDDPSKSIIISDEGEGMDYEDLRKKYLEIGRDRREEEATSIQSKAKRKPIGRKGIGKLAGFGVANIVNIKTLKNGILTEIEMDYSEIIKRKDGLYTPTIIKEDCITEERNGTTISLRDIKRKSPFNQDYIEFIASDLAKRFSVFDEDFKVTIIYNNDSTNEVEVKNELKFENLDVEFEWEIPLSGFEDNYEFKKEVTGKIFSTKGAVYRNMKGVFLLSRGKLVNQREFFDADNQDYAFTHLTGWLNVDFIETLDDDVISTNRESLNWEIEETIRLREYLTRILTKIKDDWREWRKKEKIRIIKKESGVDIDNWLENIEIGEDKKIAKKIVNTILQSSNIETDKAADLIQYIKSSFEFESFRSYAYEMAHLDQIDPAQFIKLMHDWQFIEAREIYNLSKVRIEAIKNLEKHIDDNALEVSVMEKFFSKFPWILDPRIIEFKTEQTYSKLLREHFPEDQTVIDVDKRLDFLCIDYLGQFFIIELKRPQSTINNDNLQQGLEYASFMESRLGNEHQPRVICLLVGGKLNEKAVVKSLAESLRKDGKVYFKPYNQILTEAKKYHQEIIEAFDKRNLVEVI